MKIGHTRTHAHTHTSGRQLKITFLDGQDYSEYSDTYILNFFHENIAFVMRKQNVKSCIKSWSAWAAKFVLNFWNSYETHDTAHRGVQEMGHEGEAQIAALLNAQTKKIWPSFFWIFMIRVTVYQFIQNYKHIQNIKIYFFNQKLWLKKFYVHTS